MHGLDVRTVTGMTVAAAGRDTGLQVRHRGMTQRTVAVMRNVNRSICRGARIMTVGTVGRTQGHISDSNMINTAVSRCLIRMTIQAVGRISTQGYGVDYLLPRAVVTGGTGTGTIGVDIMLGSFNFSPVSHNMAAAADRTVGEIAGTDYYGMTMRMAVKVIDRMALRAVARQCGRGVGRRVMTGGATVMLLVVCCICKECVVNRLGMTRSTLGLLRYLAGMVLGRMGCKITRNPRMTLAAITGCRTRQLGTCVMADIAVVMLQVVNRINKGSIINRGIMTARATRMLGYLRRMILGMRGPVRRYTAVTQ